MASKPFAIEVVGAPELSRKLKQFEGKVGKKLFRKAARQAAKFVLNEAQRLVPYDTGALHDSLRVKAAKRSRQRIGIEVSTREGLFKGDEFYGGFLELGTKTRPAKPYLRPALYDNQVEVQAIFIQNLREVIREEEAKRAAV